MPPKKAVEVIADEEDDQYATKDSKASEGQYVNLIYRNERQIMEFRSKGAQAKTSNPHRNVGGTA